MRNLVFDYFYIVELKLSSINEGKNILVVGDLMLDRYHIGRHTRQSPEADVPLIEEEEIDNRLGGAGNVAHNLVSLGLNPILVSTIGRDNEGEILEDLCRRTFGDYKLLKLQDRPTTLKSRIVDQEFKQYLRLDREVIADISISDEAQIIALIQSVIADNLVEIIVIQDYNKGLLTIKVIEFLHSVSKTQAIPIVVDPKKAHFKLLSICAVFKPNLKELSQAIGYLVPPEKESIDLAIKDLTLTQSNYIVVTMAENGIYYKDVANDVSGVIKGQIIDNPDVSGAGDTVLSALVKTLTAGLPIAKMAEIANQAGAAVCRKKGIDVISINELTI